MHHITDSQWPYWFTLAQAFIGISRLEKLLAYFRSAKHICKASSETLKQCRLSDDQIKTLKNPNQLWIEQALNWQSQPNHYVLLWTDERYPPLLKETTDAPPLLFIEGDIACLARPQIAMVGSRNPSYSGVEIAHEFAYQLAGAGLCVTSGLALGIDSACHEGALQAVGKTIGVLGSGLSCIYPHRNRDLARRIVDNGCLVSELLPSAGPLADHFPRRNRIISGLSLGTLIVEAALRSGSLITAKYALEQNRDVFAIPGSIRNATSKGCLSLIQQGAVCVTQVDDILNEFHIKARLNKIPIQQPMNCTLDPNALQVLACIENEPTSVDQICARSKLAAQEVSGALLQLELDGVVKMQYGCYSK